MFAQFEKLLLPLTLTIRHASEQTHMLRLALLLCIPGVGPHRSSWRWPRLCGCKRTTGAMYKRRACRRSTGFVESLYKLGVIFLTLTDTRELSLLSDDLQSKPFDC